jgi:hypothetical protein
LQAAREKAYEPGWRKRSYRHQTMKHRGSDLAGVPGRSGGHNRVSLEAHLLRGSFRPDRHAGLMEAPPPRRLSAADRRRTLAGLEGTARRLVLHLLAEYGGWHAAKLEVLRNFALSSARLEALQETPSDDARGLHREIRANLNLLKALNLED